jgi:ammonium transporter, Amt family
MHRARKLAIAAGVGVVGSLAFGATAFAQDAPTLEDVSETATSTVGNLNLLWIILGAILVIFMQAGFALVETGFCRAKHAAHVVSTNFAIFGLGFVGYFLIGFPLMFGGYSLPAIGIGYDEPFGGKLIGSGEWIFLFKGDIGLSGDAFTPAIAGFFLYMVAFMDTVATIPTGSMAERWKWNSFVVWGLFCGALYYPIVGAWTWGGGWLSQLGNSMEWGLGYVDFAGSGVVHLMGGAAALAGAIVLGPRIGKYGPDGKPRALLGHNIPMAMLGTFILLFGWFGFNAASTFSAADVQFAVVATNTAIAGAFGAVISMFWIMMRTGKPDPGMMANGMLAGLVAITAPCAFVQPWHSAIIGSIAAVLVIEAFMFIDQRLKIDDPVGAIAVHGCNGFFGVLCVGLFADGSYGAGWNATTHTTDHVTGLFYGDGGQFVAQLVSGIVIAVTGFTMSFVFFKICDAVMGIRSSEEDEIAGLDIPEMGVPAYVFTDDFSSASPASPSRVAEPESV